jgi:hypothetical protein
VERARTGVTVGVETVSIHTHTFSPLTLAQLATITLIHQHVNRSTVLVLPPVTLTNTFLHRLSF